MKDLTGQKVPNVTFHTRKNDEWVDVTTDDLFKGKKVVVFSLPGAFTPTCSATHLPRYNELAHAFRDSGIDDIICISVNDTFVMNAWLANQQASNITVVPDGNGEFTEGMGMLVDKDDLGFGKRSWRYSMLVDDGVIKKMFIEPQQPGDPFEVSDADTMLEFVNPDAKKPQAVTIFTKPGCEYCARAKKLLKEKGYDFEEIVLGQGSGASTVSIHALTGKSTVPQVFIEGKYIGGSEELAKYLNA
ncbi:glutathione peroxidase [Brackiella oedipodis]|uniref:glutathione peroxidase n=1 Tax=Brackiella oedipodis TaxID=124225 RepID=UPI00056F93E3|nr:glutathione peroxidase [Brackiella oedipodis]